MSKSSSTPQRHIHRKRSGRSLMLIIVAFTSLILVGIIFTASLAPTEIGGVPKSVLAIARNDVRMLSQKILDWLPNGHQSGLRGDGFKYPDWSKKSWTPIDIDFTDMDPQVTLCQLDFKTYTESPHLYPMFRDLETLSKCHGDNRKRERLSVLMKELNSLNGKPEGRIVKPMGFIFHESRVGSTLIANTLASDPWNMVFSESAPAANALLHCEGCNRERNIQMFRDIITLMGRSLFHERLFFKFQSISSTMMEIALEAFPDTPWAFIYRAPVQTMMSHMDPKKSTSGAPCLRSMRNPPDEVRMVISKSVGQGNPPKEAWCAAHLNMLCSSALRAYQQFNVYPDGKQRGLLINYESLPGVVARVLLPMFGISPNEKWLEKMKIESTHYSKARGGMSKLFFGDSEDKEQRATHDIQKFSKIILEPTYVELMKYSLQGFLNASPKEMSKVTIKGDVDIGWNVLKEFPEFSEIAIVKPLQYSSHSNVDSFVENHKISESIKSNGHSSFESKEFQPWIPFSNSHSSKTFAQVNCPDEPDPGYPQAFPIMDLITNWPTDNTEIPAQHYDSLCHFDFQNSSDLIKAYNYRKAEVPYVVYNIPEVDAVVNKWNDVDYLHRKLGNGAYRTETSKTNHFMYWHSSGHFEGKEKWKAPTGLIQVSFENWLETAVKGQNRSLEERTHQYFRVSADSEKGSNGWLFNELPFFRPKKSLMMVEPDEQRGIHCRFGMRSVIAEAHFDGSRNAVVMLGGMRRWILTHPDQCVNMHMLPKEHPSGRHSDVDWSNPDIVKYPNFQKIRSNEVILQPGDYLYVPTYWIHYIISLNVNFQCNTRSGRHSSYDKFIAQCGF